MSTDRQTNEKLRLLLVEDDTAACAEFISYIDGLSDMELVGVTNSSFRAFELVRSLYPDALILDLELHAGSGNGLLLLNDMHTLEPSEIPYTVITTNNTSNITFESARRLGADFIFTKYQENYSSKSVVDFIRLMGPVIKKGHGQAALQPSRRDCVDIIEHNKRMQIHAEFDTLGMSNKTLGYCYLTDAVSLMMERQTANIPFVLSKQYKKTPASIERAMQHAISSTWDSLPLDVLSTHYTAHINPERQMPTIMEFVSYYANKLKNCRY